MNLTFRKMHGLGNDFVVIDATKAPVSLSDTHIKLLGDRNRGVGFEQLLILKPTTMADCEFAIEIYNSDASRAGNCGNGMRCLAWYAKKYGLVQSDQFQMQLGKNKIGVSIQSDQFISVEMGPPSVLANEIPLAEKYVMPIGKGDNSGYSIEIMEQEISFVAVSMGNPHAVIIVDDIATAEVENIGHLLQHHKAFPDSVNVGFMQVIARNEVNLRVFERGCGETAACGSGACAAAVAGQLLGLLDSEVNLNLPGGKLNVYWSGEENSAVRLSGPATDVYSGAIEI